MLRRPRSRLALWWARHELLGKGYMLYWARVHEGKRWVGAPVVESKGIWHGYRMKADVGDYYERFAHFYGRYHDLPIHLFLFHAVRKGEVFVDVGANMGFVMLAAAWVVGDEGEVWAFEPNPRCFERSKWHRDANKLGQVRLLQAGLSDEVSKLTLSVPANNTGAGTLGRYPKRYGPIGTRIDVDVKVGDDVLTAAKNAPMVIKIDVEGHETRVLRGLDATLRSRRPAVITEVNRRMLVDNGSSAQEMFRVMWDHGYERFLWQAEWRGLKKRRLALYPCPKWWPKVTVDAIWLHPQSEHYQRLRPCMRPRREHTEADEQT